MSMKAAFNMMIRMNSRSATITRIATPSNITGTIKIAPSNYFRNLEVVNQLPSKGREFVISKVDLDLITGLGTPKRGDRLVDSTLGTMVIEEVREMFILGAEIVGYRVRTN